MAEKPSTAVTVGGVLAAVAGAVVGRMLGWLFGLQIVLPLVVGFFAYGAFKKSLKPEGQPYAAALGLQAGYLAWVVIGILMMLLNNMFFLGIQGIILHLISIVAFVALIVQPGVPPALLLLLRHAWSLVLVLISLPNMIKHSEYISRHAIVDTIIVTGISVAAIVLLARAMMASSKA